MGLFKSDKHLFAYFEKYSIERKFLNIFKIVKDKNIEFISREEFRNDDRYQTNYDSINYNFLINNKDVRFGIQKLILTNIDEFNKRYDSFGDYLYTGVNYQGKLNKGGNSFIGLPKVNSDYFPYTILEIGSFVQEKNTKSKTKLIYKNEEYLILQNLMNGWRKEVERDFNIVSDIIIKETVKKTK